ncbi:DUF2807 domain-containing protein [Pedobacter sp. MC2016-14]|uniref:head GIN domain-containing protein n=1 Tax=Pedobacter sp. MC2016-14 TaxID=2897327 RepID=UPI001E4D9B57|nr:head GIN domain-containing protein [Pedobacter sp. MC2016-14]MCD0486825.1 DUF2807 domain-containing protein [Pedobacter sp. MC2016-14]
MKAIYTLLLASTLCGASFKASANAAAGFQSYTNPTDERKVKDFHGIGSGGPIEVIVHMGSTESLKFEGDAEAIATLVAEVRNGILVIRPKNSWKSWAKTYENKKITAHVNAKSLSSITISGDGSIVVIGTVTAEALTTTLSGSGSIKANIDADKLTTVISGSGQLNLQGKTSQISANLSGSCNFEGSALATENLTARISGSGKITIKASNRIKATILGSGQIRYSGNPEIEKTVVGSGEVVEL